MNIQENSQPKTTHITALEETSEVSVGKSGNMKVDPRFSLISDNKKHVENVNKNPFNYLLTMKDEKGNDVNILQTLKSHETRVENDNFNDGNKQAKIANQIVYELSQKYSNPVDLKTMNKIPTDVLEDDKLKIAFLTHFLNSKTYQAILGNPNYNKAYPNSKLNKMMTDVHIRGAIQSIINNHNRGELLQQEQGKLLTLKIGVEGTTANDISMLEQRKKEISNIFNHTPSDMTIEEITNQITAIDKLDKKYFELSKIPLKDRTHAQQIEYDEIDIHLEDLKQQYIEFYEYKKIKERQKEDQEIESFSVKQKEDLDHFINDLRALKNLKGDTLKAELNRLSLLATNKKGDIRTEQGKFKNIMSEKESISQDHLKLTNAFRNWNLLATYMNTNYADLLAGKFSKLASIPVLIDYTPPNTKTTHSTTSTVDSKDKLKPVTFDEYVSKVDLILSNNKNLKSVWSATKNPDAWVSTQTFYLEKAINELSGIQQEDESTMDIKQIRDFILRIRTTQGRQNMISMSVTDDYHHGMINPNAGTILASKMSKVEARYNALLHIQTKPKIAGMKNIGGLGGKGEKIPTVAELLALQQKQKKATEDADSGLSTATKVAIGGGLGGVAGGVGGAVSKTTGLNQVVRPPIIGANAPLPGQFDTKPLTQRGGGVVGENKPGLGSKLKSGAEAVGNALAKKGKLTGLIIGGSIIGILRVTELMDRFNTKTDANGVPESEWSKHLVLHSPAQIKEEKMAMVKTQLDKIENGLKHAKTLTELEAYHDAYLDYKTNASEFFSVSTSDTIDAWDDVYYKPQKHYLEQVAESKKSKLLPAGTTQPALSQPYINTKNSIEFKQFIVSIVPFDTFNKYTNKNQIELIDTFLKVFKKKTSDFPEYKPTKPGELSQDDINVKYTDIFKDFLNGEGVGFKSFDGYSVKEQDRMIKEFLSQRGYSYDNFDKYIPPKPPTPPVQPPPPAQKPPTKPLLPESGSKALIDYEGLKNSEEFKKALNEKIKQDNLPKDIFEKLSDEKQKQILREFVLGLSLDDLHKGLGQKLPTTKGNLGDKKNKDVIFVNDIAIDKEELIDPRFLDDPFYTGKKKLVDPRYKYSGITLDKDELVDPRFHYPYFYDRNGIQNYLRPYKYIDNEKVHYEDYELANFQKQYRFTNIEIIEQRSGQNTPFYLRPFFDNSQSMFPLNYIPNNLKKLTDIGISKYAGYQAYRQTPLSRHIIGFMSNVNERTKQQLEEREYILRNNNRDIERLENNIIQNNKLIDPNIQELEEVSSKLDYISVHNDISNEKITLQSFNPKAGEIKFNTKELNNIQTKIDNQKRLEDTQLSLLSDERSKSKITHNAVIRDFFYKVLLQYPQTSNEDLIKKFENLPFDKTLQESLTTRYTSENIGRTAESYLTAYKEPLLKVRDIFNAPLIDTELISRIQERPADQLRKQFKGLGIVKQQKLLREQGHKDEFKQITGQYLGQGNTGHINKFLLHLDNKPNLEIREPIRPRINIQDIDNADILFSRETNIQERRAMIQINDLANDFEMIINKDKQKNPLDYGKNRIYLSQATQTQINTYLSKKLKQSKINSVITGSNPQQLNDLNRKLGNNLAKDIQKVYSLNNKIKEVDNELSKLNIKNPIWNQKSQQLKLLESKKTKLDNIIIRSIDRTRFREIELTEESKVAESIAKQFLDNAITDAESEIRSITGQLSQPNVELPPELEIINNERQEKYNNLNKRLSELIIKRQSLNQRNERHLKEIEIKKQENIDIQRPDFIERNLIRLDKGITASTAAYATHQFSKRYITPVLYPLISQGYENIFPTIVDSEIEKLKAKSMMNFDINDYEPNRPTPPPSQQGTDAPTVDPFDKYKNLTVPPSTAQPSTTEPTATPTKPRQPQIDIALAPTAQFIGPTLGPTKAPTKPQKTDMENRIEKAKELKQIETDRMIDDDNLDIASSQNSFLSNIFFKIESQIESYLGRSSNTSLKNDYKKIKNKIKNRVEGVNQNDIGISNALLFQLQEEEELKKKLKKPILSNIYDVDKQFTQQPIIKNRGINKKYNQRKLDFFKNNTGGKTRSYRSIMKEIGTAEEKSKAQRKYPIFRQDQAFQPDKNLMERYKYNRIQ